MKVSRRRFVKYSASALALTTTSLLGIDNFGTALLDRCGCYPEKNIMKDYLSFFHPPKPASPEPYHGPAYRMIPDRDAFRLERERMPESDVKKFAYTYVWHNGYTTPDRETIGTRHWSEPYKFKPRRGEYSSRNPRLVAKQLNDAWTHNFIPIYSFWGADMDGRSDGFEDETLREFVLRSPYLKKQKVEFATLVESEGILGSQNFGCEIALKSNEKTFYDQFNHLKKNVFNHPNYLQMDGRPVVFIYNAHRFNPDEAADIFENLRKEMFLFGAFDFWRDPNNERIRRLIGMFDGITAYNLFTTSLSLQIPPNFKEEAIKRCEQYSSLSKYFIQPTLQTFRKDGYPEFVMTDEEYEKYLGIAKGIARNKKNPMMSGVYNEVHESFLEENEEYGRKPLELFGSV